MSVSPLPPLVLYLLLLATFPPVTVTGDRTEACMMLVAVDQTVLPLFQNNEDLIRTKVKQYVEKLNSIYESSILQSPPHHNIYFQVKELRVLRNFLPGCENKGVLLNEFSKVGTAGFCLAHLLTYRDFGCVVGLANIGGLCRRYGNTGWTKVDPNDDAMTVNTIAHEIGHNFGSDHDGGESPMYSGCSSIDKQGIMGGKQTGNFSTCSLSAMHAKLQTVLRDEKEKHCFTQVKKNDKYTFDLKIEDYTGYEVACPKVIDTDCEDDQPDTPDVPEPPEEPQCGDFEVAEPFEECDCGTNYVECTDPCCYPAVISEEDLSLNSSAKPCMRNESPSCVNPYKSAYTFGLMYPFLFILLIFLILAIILWVDWRCGWRLCYAHITAREEKMRDALHVENEEQRERRIQREKENTKLKKEVPGYVKK